MNDLNTKTIINFLPLDPQPKLKLLENFDSLPLPEQIRITRIIWDCFNSIYEQRIRNKFEDGINSESDKTNGTYYMKVLNEINKEINDELTSHQESAEISEVRKSMEQIVAEINALKKPPAPQK